MYYKIRLSILFYILNYNMDKVLNTLNILNYRN